MSTDDVVRTLHGSLPIMNDESNIRTWIMLMVSGVVLPKTYEYSFRTGADPLRLNDTPKPVRPESSRPSERGGNVYGRPLGLFERSGMRTLLHGGQRKEVEPAPVGTFTEREFDPPPPGCELYSEMGTVAAIMIARYIDDKWPKLLARRKKTREQRKLRKDKKILKKKV